MDNIKWKIKWQTERMANKDNQEKGKEGKDRTQKGT